MDSKKERHEYDADGNLINGFFDGYDLKLGTNDIELLNWFSIGYQANKVPELAEEMENILISGSPFAEGYFLGKELQEKERKIALREELKNARKKSKDKEIDNDIER